MGQLTSARAGAICGPLFVIGLFAGNRAGVLTVELVALVLFLPFLASLVGLMRRAEGGDGWLATTALCGGIAGVALKLVSIAPGVAADDTTAGTPLHAALDTTANVATVACLLPLALLLAAVASLGLRTGFIPRWLALGAAATALALAVNGCFIDSDFVPALLLFLLWTLLAGLVLARDGRPEGRREPADAEPAPAR